ncbi:MAG: glycosyl transferase family 28, partial [Chitinophagaceae bacterium]
MTINEKINIPHENVPVILVAPLDWGLGHATRCIPIITHLLTIGCKVIVAAEGKQRLLLKQEFAGIRCVYLQGYRVEYGTKGWQTLLKISLQLPKLLRSIKQENRWLQKFILENKVNGVISDNRYGLFSKQVPSVFITHQLNVKCPFGPLVESFIQQFIYKYINKFNQCWVPDYEGDVNLAAELSHPKNLPATTVKYLGRLSRISRQANNNETGPLLILLSGPEPQRTSLEVLLLNQLTSYTESAILVRGLPG